MIGDFYDGFEGFLRQIWKFCCLLLKLLEPFPASKGTLLIILDGRGGLTLLLAPLYFRNQLQVKSLTTKILYLIFEFLFS